MYNKHICFWLNHDVENTMRREAVWADFSRSMLHILHKNKSGCIEYKNFIRDPPYFYLNYMFV